VAEELSIPSRGYLERVSPRVIDHMLHRDPQQKRNIMSVLGKLRSGSAIEIRTLRNCCTTKTEGDPASPESGRVYASAGMREKALDKLDHALELFAEDTRLKD
jgi:hypothetical protein